MSSDNHPDSGHQDSGHQDSGHRSIRLVLADVDGTLVTSEKALTPRAVEAVHRLHGAGVKFAVTSGRPPRGMEMLIDPLALTTPLAGFNGGIFVHTDMSVLEQKVIPEQVVQPVIDLLRGRGLDVWLYRRSDWFVLDPEGPHVDREARTVEFPPQVVDSYADMSKDIAKIVGVSDDRQVIDRATKAAQEEFGEHVSAAESQPYYLDLTHPDANKGGVVEFLSHCFDIDPTEIATIGDMPNDVLMFRRSTLSIAMGNASEEVQQAAHRVTLSNDEDGFAHAVDRFILGGGE